MNAYENPVILGALIEWHTPGKYFYTLTHAEAMQTGFTVAMACMAEEVTGH